MSGTTVFFSYAHQDEPLVEELKKHLIPFKRQGLIAEWYDHNILPGTTLNAERERQLSHASLIVLCITPDFLNSDYCYGIEMRQAMVRHANGDAWVLPILLKPVYWENAPSPPSNHCPKTEVSSQPGPTSIPSFSTSPRAF